MSYQNHNPAGARELLEGGEGWTYLDVRTVEEFDQGHVPGAYNIPIAVRDPSGQMAMNEAFADVVSRHFPKEARLVLGCAAGGRSQRACEVLAAAGYTALVNMHGGFSGARDMSGAVVEPGWAACGYPTESGPCAERGYDALQGA